MSGTGASKTKRRSRWPLWLGGGTAVVLLGGGATGWILRAPIAEALAKNWCESRSLNCSLDITSLSLGSVTIENLRIETNGQAPLQIGRTQVDLDWPGLTSPQPTRVALDRFILSGRVEDDEVWFYGLENALSSGGDGGGAVLPEIEMTNATVSLDTDSGPLRLDLDARGDFPSDFTVQASVAPTALSMGADRLDLTGGTLNVTWTDGVPEGDGSIGVDRLEWEDFTVSGLEIDLSATPSGADTYKVGLVGSSDLLAFGPRRVESLQFELGADGAAPNGDTVADTIDALEAFSLTLLSGPVSAPEAQALGIAFETSLTRELDGRITGPVFASAEGLAAAQFAAERMNLDGDVSVTASGTDVSGLSAVFSAVLTGASAGPEPRAMLRSIFDLPAPFDAHGEALGNALSNGLGRFDAATEIDLTWSDGASFKVSSRRPARLGAATGLNMSIAPRQSDEWLSFTPESLQLSGDVSLSGGGAPELSAGIERLDYSFDTGALDFRAAPISMQTWQAGALALGLSAERLSISMAGETLRIIGVGEISLDGDIAGLDVTETRLFAGINAVRDGGGLRMQMSGTDCLALRTGGIRSGTLAFDPFTVSLCPEEGRLLQRESGTTRGRAQLGSIDIGFAGQDLSGALNLTGATADWTLTDHFQIKLQARDATVPLILPSGDVRLRSASPLLDIDLFPAAPRIVARLGETSLSGSLIPATVTAGALSFRGFAEPTGLRASGDFSAVRVADINADPIYEPLEAEGAYSLNRERLVMTSDIRLAEGTQRLARARMDMDVFALDGTLTLEGDRLEFSPRGLQPGDISGRVVGFFTEATGAVTPRADLVLTGGSLSGTGSVLLEGLSWITLRLGSVTEVSGLVEFEDLISLRTPPGQTLFISEINPGIPLRDGTLRFQLLGASEARLESASWPFAGGSLDIEPTRWTVQSNLETVNARLSDIDLSQLIDLIKVPDLDITGTASGVFPVTISGPEVLIKDATLRVSDGGGVVRYTGAAGQQAGMADEKAEMTFNALENFQFSVLSMTINGNLLGNLRVETSITGKNPDVLQGQVFNMNIGVEGALLPLINKTTRLLSGDEVEAFVEDLLRKEEQGSNP